MSLSNPARRILRPATRLTRRQALRTFHSYDHPPPSGPFSLTESSILSAAYKYVPEHGFTKRALGLGARDAEYLDISASVLVDAEFSLIRWHLVQQREALKTKSVALFGEGDKIGVREKVETLTWERLLANKDIIGQWQEALAIMAQPHLVPESVKELAQLSDEIWFLAGDKAVDPSWYSKRASLSMIYSSSELFMTNDRSSGFTETAEFMQRRLGEVQTISGAASAVGQWVGFTLSAGVNVLRSKGARL